MAEIEKQKACETAMDFALSDEQRLLEEQAIQLHGGIGMTDEYVACRYFKHLVAIERSFGDSDHHLDRFAAARFPKGIDFGAC